MLRKRCRANREAEFASADSVWKRRCSGTAAGCIPPPVAAAFTPAEFSQTRAGPEVLSRATFYLSRCSDTYGGTAAMASGRGIVVAASATYLLDLAARRAPVADRVRGS